MGGQDGLLGNIFNIIISEKPWVMVAGRFILMDWASWKFGFTIRFGLYVEVWVSTW